MLIVAAATLPSAVSAENAQPLQASFHSSAPPFDLASPSVVPLRVYPLLPAAASPQSRLVLPRELPAVPVDDARPIPTPGVDWHPRVGTVVKLRPAKLRLRMDF